MRKKKKKIPQCTIKVMASRGQDPVRTDTVVTENTVKGQAAHLKYFVILLMNYIKI
jgi:hypothetical protein